MRPLALLAVLPLVACSGAGYSADRDAPGIVRSYTLADFDTVAATGPDDVEIHVGPAFSVRARGAPDVLDRLEIVKDGSSLKIGRKPGSSWNGGGSHGARIVVTLPRLAAAATKGSGDIAIDRVEGDAFRGSASGSGDLTVAALSVRSLGLSVTGSGTITAAGLAGTGALSIAGSGNIAAPDLRISTATVSVTGSGDVRAKVVGTASLQLTGSGDITLTGGARCTIAKAGSGEARCS